jgi:hypothetical protein
MTFVYTSIGCIWPETAIFVNLDYVKKRVIMAFVYTLFFIEVIVFSKVLFLQMIRKFKLHFITLAGFFVFG